MSALSKKGSTISHRITKATLGIAKRTTWVDLLPPRGGRPDKKPLG
jgi:hypothetical protein